ncbi:regulatory protein BlaR1 [Anaerotignum neopropionicum]|uniref:Regulatory protein BlaR1 n=1 Tax=Anaerotignum neopropionicum TaxID=36847 RepID=A0A136WB92_9FIRM|nr:M56 family metallopeptidase [Anaerotignum neopropionicum]KXL51780.1 regulatory protein BlaR1 [Anaerotignum neopropionicum]
MILFQNVLEISVFTSVAIVFLGVLSHFLGKRYGVKWRYFVWLMIALRLIMPISFTLPRPIMKIPVPQVRMHTIDDTEVSLPETDYFSEASFPVVESNNTQNELTQPLPTENTPTILEEARESLWIFWLFGMAIYFIYQGKKYRSFLINLKRNSRCIRDAEVLEVFYAACSEMNMIKRPEIFFCGILPSPLCIGFFHQKIYLNQEEYPGEQLRFILKHELVHLKRRDIWYKALLLFARGVHFFNPFIYWMVRLAERDIEYSCDSLVLEKCSFSQRQEYGLTILESIRQGGQTNPLSTAFYGGKEELKARIDYIFDMGKKKRGILLLLMLLLLVWVGTAFVGCSQNEETAQTSNEEVDWAGALYQCKLDYIGNHDGVGDILRKLTLPEGIQSSTEGIELFTSKEPYGARRYLTLEKGASIPENGWFEKDAMIFLALVDNASFFEYYITDENGEKSGIYFDRKDGAQYFGDTDLRSMAADESTFRNFLRELELLFPESGDYARKQIECNVLLNEIAEEMGETFSYDLLKQNVKYDELLKLGDGALTALFIEFQKGQPDDTRGYIMMTACLELLKIPATMSPTLVEEMKPSQWYEAYCALDSMVAEPFLYDEERYSQDLEKDGLLTMKNATKEGLITRHSDVMKAVYTAMEQHFSSDKSNREVQIFAPLISHISESEDKLSVYAVIGFTEYTFIRTPNVGYQLVEGGGSLVPSRLDFERKEDGWILVEWVEVNDGSEYAPSIEEMCKGTNGVANAMLTYDRREMQMLLMQNLIFYLKDKTQITVYKDSHMEEQDIQEVSQYISFVQI